jgi:hypothetical protein
MAGCLSAAATESIATICGSSGIFQPVVPAGQLDRGYLRKSGPIKVMMAGDSVTEYMDSGVTMLDYLDKLTDVQGELYSTPLTPPASSSPSWSSCLLLPWPSCDTSWTWRFLLVKPVVKHGNPGNLPGHQRNRQLFNDPWDNLLKNCPRMAALLSVGGKRERRPRLHGIRARSAKIG